MGCGTSSPRRGRASYRADDVWVPRDESRFVGHLASGIRRAKKVGQFGRVSMVLREEGAEALDVVAVVVIRRVSASRNRQGRAEFDGGCGLLY